MSPGLVSKELAVNTKPSGEISVPGPAACRPGGDEGTGTPEDRNNSVSLSDAGAVSAQVTVTPTKAGRSLATSASAALSLAWPDACSQRNPIAISALK